jgi:hypothetical protein
VVAAEWTDGCCYTLTLRPSQGLPVDAITAAGNKRAAPKLDDWRAQYKPRPRRPGEPRPHLECGRAFTRGPVELVGRICRASFTNESSMKEHQWVFHDYEPFCCRECGQQSASGSNLDKHVKAHHNRVSRVCPECNKQLGGRSDNFKRHVKACAGAAAAATATVVAPVLVPAAAAAPALAAARAALATAEAAIAAMPAAAVPAPAPAADFDFNTEVNAPLAAPPAADNTFAAGGDLLLGDNSAEDNSARKIISGIDFTGDLAASDAADTGFTAGYRYESEINGDDDLGSLEEELSPDEVGAYFE